MRIRQLCLQRLEFYRIVPASFIANQGLQLKLRFTAQILLSGRSPETASHPGISSNKIGRISVIRTFGLFGSVDVVEIDQVAGKGRTKNIENVERDKKRKNQRDKQILVRLFVLKGCIS